MVIHYDVQAHTGSTNSPILKKVRMNMGTLYLYTPPDTSFETLSRRQQQIYDILLREKELGYNALKTKVVATRLMGHNQFDDELKRLIKEEIIIKSSGKDGKYRIKNLVKCVRARNPFNSELCSGGKGEKDMIIEWLALEELPLDMQKRLTKPFPQP